VLDVDGLVEAVFSMAAGKRGALIVLKGKEPLDRHLSGGIALGGKMSKPLLYSIFDNHSAGHDGAVVVDDRIDQFAAHLPISTNAKSIAGRGTRHSAALGLSERSDALTIVVSEERGTVSVAVGEKLTEVATAADLKRRVDRYLSSISPQATQPLWARIVLQHGMLKLLAFSIAVVAWFALAYDPHRVQRTFAVPVVYRNLPSNLVLDETAPNEARVTLSGLERNFRFLEPGGLRIALDLADVKGGYYEFPITEEHISLPANLSPYRIEPAVIRLYLRQRMPDEGRTPQASLSTR